MRSNSYVRLRDRPVGGHGFMLNSSQGHWQTEGANAQHKRKECGMIEAKIKYMIDRFLMWRLPKPWNPDNGISYQRPNYAHAPTDHDWPTGTNLFDVQQATAMVQYMLEGMPNVSDCLNGRCNCRSSAECKFTRCKNCDNPVDDGKTLIDHQCDEFETCPDCGGPLNENRVYGSLVD